MTSPGDSPEASTTKSRVIRKRECFLCEGKGFVAGELLSTRCDGCDGLGWVLNGSGEEGVCATCNGNGSVTRKADIPCSYCSGKGYVVKIVEICRRKSACSNCNGSGVVVEKHFHIECPECKGHLWTTNSYSDTKLCPTCCGKGELTIEEPHESVCKACGGHGGADTEYEIDVTPPAITEADRLYRLEDDHRGSWAFSEWIDHASAWGKLGRPVDEKRCLEIANRLKTPTNF